jgi:hypothetical protein
MGYPLTILIPSAPLGEHFVNSSRLAAISRELFVIE